MINQIHTPSEAIRKAHDITSKIDMTEIFSEAKYASGQAIDIKPKILLVEWRKKIIEKNLLIILIFKK